MNRLSNKKIIAQLEYTTEKVFRKLKSISKLESSFQVTIEPTTTFDAIGEKIKSFKIHGNEENVDNCYEYYQNFSSENFEFWDNKLTLKKEKQERHKTRQQSEMARRQVKEDNRRWLMDNYIDTNMSLLDPNILEWEVYESRTNPYVSEKVNEMNRNSCKNWF